MKHRLAVLCSPRFLYLYDQPVKGVRDDFNLASRLSFFLWGSIPDDELLELAETKHPSTGSARGAGGSDAE